MSGFIVITLMVLLFILPGDLYYLYKLKNKKVSCLQSKIEKELDRKYIIYANIFAILAYTLALIALFL